jgi:2-keto-3-deoxy-L-rhamnonate aldolase RhmA
MGTDAPRGRLPPGPAFGPFVKMANHQIVEIFALSGFDFVVIDAEHAPFSALELDRMLAVAWSCGLPALVRVPDQNPSFIGMCLDLGAAGVVVPHVSTAAAARQLAAATRYKNGRRGFSPSPRAARYGTAPSRELRAEADATVQLWCQIEDQDAIECIDEIAAVTEIACLLIGPMDLSLSMGAADPQELRVQEAIEAVTSAGLRHGRTTGIALANLDDTERHIGLGMTRFVCSSDQSMLLNSATRMARAGRSPLKAEEKR